MQAKGRLLVMENQRVDSGWLLRSLESWGYEADWVRTAQQAIEKLDAHAKEPTYVGAIFDVMVPTGSEQAESNNDQRFQDALTTGLRACAYARETLKLTPQEFPIILLTIVPRDVDVLEPLLKKGQALYLAKEEVALNRNRLLDMLQKA